MTENDAQGTFLESLERHRGILSTVANAYCGDVAGREDLTGEIVAQLWRAYPRFDGRCSFSTWMYRIAVNVAISFYRSKRRESQYLPRADEVLPEDVAAPQDAQQDERIAALRAKIDRLDDLNRALMILYLDDRPYSEIAEILGISQTNVATKINRLKYQLKRSIAAEEVT